MLTSSPSRSGAQHKSSGAARPQRAVGREGGGSRGFVLLPLPSQGKDAIAAAHRTYTETSPSIATNSRWFFFLSEWTLAPLTFFFSFSCYLSQVHMMKRIADFTSNQINLGGLFTMNNKRSSVIKSAEKLHAVLYTLYWKQSWSGHTENKFGGVFLKIVFVHTQTVFHKELRAFLSFLPFLSCSLNKSFTTSAPLLLEISHHYKRKVS